MVTFSKLPKDLQAGAVKAAYDKAIAAGTDGNYEDGETRYYTCQTYHMSPVAGQASSTLHNAPKTRIDVTLSGAPRQVNSILDLHDTNTKIYEVHGTIAQKWA